VKDEEVEERLRALQNLHANLKTISETRPIQAGDFVIVDYEASMGGKPLEGGKAIDFTVEVGSGQFIPALEEKLIGLKPEEERRLKSLFPRITDTRSGLGRRFHFTLRSKRLKKRSFLPWMMSLQKIWGIIHPSKS